MGESGHGKEKRRNQRRSAPSGLWERVQEAALQAQEANDREAAGIQETQDSETIRKRRRPVYLPWGKNYQKLNRYLLVLRRRYGGRLPYPEQLRHSLDPKERAFRYALERDGKLDILPRFGEIQALQAESEYQEEHFGETRGKLALVKPSLHRRLWRHRAKGSLEIVPIVEKQNPPWGNDAWGYYARELSGKSRGRVKMISDALYQALRRQILEAGTVLPDGSVLAKACFAIEQIPLRQRKAKAS